MIFAIIVAILAAVVTASADLSSLYSMESSRVLAGEYWRLLSGHLAHLTWNQYVIDAPVFVLLYSTYSKRAGTISAIFLSFCAALSISFTIILTGRYEVYGGFSGLSCAAVSAILFSLFIKQPRKLFPYFMFFSYCIYLLLVNVSASGVTVAREAHIAGAISGLIFALVREGKQKISLFYNQISAPTNR